MRRQLETGAKGASGAEQDVCAAAGSVPTPGSSRAATSLSSLHLGSGTNTVLALLPRCTGTLRCTKGVVIARRSAEGSLI